MTPKQQKFYLQTWLQIVHTQGWKTDLDARRRALHTQLGLPHSSKEFSNKHFNKWLEGTAHLRDQVDLRDRDRENLLHRIKDEAYKMFSGDAWEANQYVAKLVRDKHDTGDLDSLSDQQLTQLLMTLKDRAKAHSASPISQPELDHETATLIPA